MPRRKPFHRLSRSQVDIRIPGILSDSQGNLDAAGPPLASEYLKELVAGLYDKKLGDYTGFRMVACQGGGQRLAGVYPGFQIATDGSPNHLVWTGERPRSPEPGTEEGQRRVSFRLLARHLVTRLERLSPDYNCDWTLRMHLHCTVQLQREHEALRTPAEETLALIRQVCTPQSPGLAIERPNLIEQAVRALLDHYPEQLDLVSGETLKRRFTLEEARVVRMVPKTTGSADLFPTVHFLRLCSLFAYLLRKHEVLRQHPTLPEQLIRIADLSPSGVLHRQRGTVLGSVRLHRATTRRYEYIQAATTLLAHELVAPENTRYTTFSAPILLEAIRCLAECFQFPFPSDVIDELGRYYEIQHGSSRPGSPPPGPEAPVEHQETNSGHKEQKPVGRLRIPRGKRSP